MNSFFQNLVVKKLNTAKDVVDGIMNDRTLRRKLHAPLLKSLQDDKEFYNSVVALTAELIDNHNSQKNLIEKTVEKTLEGALTLEDVKECNVCTEFVDEMLFRCVRFCLEQTMSPQIGLEMGKKMLTDCPTWIKLDLAPKELKTSHMTAKVFRTWIFDLYANKRQNLQRHMKDNAGQKFEKARADAVKQYKKMTYNSHSEIEIALTKFERGLVKVVGKPVANWGIKHGIKTSYDKTTPQGYAMYNFVNSILKKKEKRNLKIHVANLKKELIKKLEDSS